MSQGRLVRLAVDDVVVVGRHRKDLGDIDSLADSVLAVGLLHPIVVDPQHRLISGERRLAAWRKLHGTTLPIPAHVITTVDSAVLHLWAERDENTCRLDFAPTEAVALGLALEELEKPKAEARRAANLPNAPKGQVATTEPGKVRDKVAPAVGMSPRTYEKAKVVVEAAQDKTLPAPVREIARQAAEDMDATGKVDGAYRRVVDAQLTSAGMTTDDKALLLRRNAARLLDQSLKGLFALDAAHVAAVLDADEWVLWESAARGASEWFQALNAARPRGLKAV